MGGGREERWEQRLPQVTIGVGPGPTPQVLRPGIYRGCASDDPVTWVPAWAEAERGKSPDRISYPPPPEDSMETEICLGHRVVCPLWRRGYQGANINPVVTELLPPLSLSPGQGWNGTAPLRMQKAAEEFLL